MRLPQCFRSRLAPVRAQSTPVPAIRAARINGPAPVIDGNLTDAAWVAAPHASGFIQREPKAGDLATEQTDVAVVSDDAAIYIAMRMYDSHPGSIEAPLSRRDDPNAPSDWAHVAIDSNHDRRTAFKFSVTPRGVQYDGLLYEDTREDGNWDAVWDVATRIDSLGWTAEFRIPLSQLRYTSSSDGGPSTWGIEFVRDLFRKSELSLWAPIPPGTGRLVSLFGDLPGMDGLATPRRLEILPYTVGRLTRAPGSTANPFYSRNDGSASAGADFKYGHGCATIVTRSADGARHASAREH